MNSHCDTPNNVIRDKALPVPPAASQALLASPPVPAKADSHIVASVRYAHDTDAPIVFSRHDSPHVRTEFKGPTLASLAPVYDKENIRGRKPGTIVGHGRRPSPIYVRMADQAGTKVPKKARSSVPLSPRTEMMTRGVSYVTSPEGFVAGPTYLQDMVCVYDDLSVYTSSPASYRVDLRRSVSDARSYVSGHSMVRSGHQRPPRSRRPRGAAPSAGDVNSGSDVSSLHISDSSSGTSGRSTADSESDSSSIGELDEVPSIVRVEDNYVTSSKHPRCPHRSARSQKPPSLLSSSTTDIGNFDEFNLATPRPQHNHDSSRHAPSVQSSTLIPYTSRSDFGTPNHGEPNWEVLARKSDMTYSLGNEHGRMASGTVFEAFRYLMRVPNTPAVDNPALLAEMRLRSVFWSTWRHHIPSTQFFAYVRAVYCAWSATSTMIGLTDGLVQRICSDWFGLWITDVDEPIAESIREWIQTDVERLNPYHAAQLLCEFEARKQRASVQPIMCDIFMHHDATQAEPALKLDLPKDMASMGYLSIFMEGAGLEEFVRQLTLIFSRTYKTMPAAQILVLDWFLGGEDRHYIAPEREFLDLYNNLYKWVVRGITESVSEETCAQLALFWMEVEKRCFERRNLAAAAAIHDGLESAVCSRRWEKQANTFIAYKNKLLKLGRHEHPAFASHKLQRHYWLPGPAKDGANYHDLILTNRVHDDGPFIPHLARHRAPAVRHKGAGKTALSWTEDGQLILCIDVLRELSQMSIPLEWGYRSYHYAENRQVHNWIKSKLSALQDWTAPSLLDPEGKMAKKCSKALEMSPRLPHLLLQAYLPKKKPAQTPSAPTSPDMVASSASSVQSHST